MSLLIGGSRGRRRRAPPNRINFFHFHIRFCRKVYASEVGAPPPNGSAPPPTGNPGSATATHFNTNRWMEIHLGIQFPSKSASSICKLKFYLF